MLSTLLHEITFPGELMIMGENFGAVREAVTVEWHDGRRWRICEKVDLHVDHKILKVVIGSGSGTGNLLRVDIAGQVAQAEFNFAAPLVVETSEYVHVSLYQFIDYIFLVSSVC